MPGENPIHIPITGELDLHTFAPHETNQVLEAYFGACLEKGIFRVRVIHGKGTGTLRETVHAFLRRSPRVASFQLGNETSGSWGATVVFLNEPHRPPPRWRLLSIAGFTEPQPSMKPYLVYGAVIAISNAVVTLILYLAGFHSATDKLPGADLFSLLIGLAIGISCMVAGVRMKRNLTPPTDEFSFGMALGIAIVIALFATLLSTVFQFVYQSFINPSYVDLALQLKISELARGASSDQNQKAEQTLRFIFSPAMLAVANLILGIVGNVIISLIIAAFMRRRAVVDPTIPSSL